MSASVFSFSRFETRRAEAPKPLSRNWSAQELAELYRVRDRLSQSGLSVCVEVGLSDEAEPWAVFVQSETGDVFVHIARIDGEMVVVNTAHDTVYRGRDFRAITDQMMQEAPLALPRHAGGDGKVVMHPRAVFTAFVAAAVVLAEFARSIEPAHAADDAAPVLADAKGGFSVLLDRLLSREHVTPSQVGFAASATAAGLLSAAAGAVALAQGNDDGEASTAAEAEGRSSTDGSIPTGVVSARMEEVGPSSGPTDFAALTPDYRSNAISLGGVHSATQARIPFADQATDTHLTAPIFVEFDQSAPAGRAVTTMEPVLDLPEASPEARTQKVTGASATSGAVDVDSMRTQTVAHVKVDPNTVSSPEPPGPTATLHKINEAVIFLDLSGPDGPIDVARALATAGAGRDAVSTKEIDLAARPDAAAADDEPVATAPEPKQFAIHMGGGPNSKPVRLGDGTIDFVVFDGKNLDVYNFSFDEDFICVAGSISSSEWIQDVEVLQDLVVITGTNGATISLHGAHGLIA